MTAWFANLSIRSRFVLPIAAMMLINLVSAGLRDIVVHVQASADEVATGSA